MIINFTYGMMHQLNEGITKAENLFRSSDSRLPVKLSYPFYKNSKIVYDFVKHINNKRNELVKQFAQRDENGASKTKEVEGVEVIDFGDNEQQFDKEFRSFLDEKVPVGFFRVPKKEYEEFITSNESLSYEAASTLFFFVEEYFGFNEDLDK